MVANTASGAASGAAAGGSVGGGWGAAIGGALGAVGSLFGASKSSKSAKRAAEMQILWEMTKAQNAHQWEVEDLKKAGLNPVLSANGGAQAGSINPPMPDTSGYGAAGQNLLNGINSAMSILQNQKKIDSESALNDAKTITEGIDAGLKPRETAVKEMNAVSDRMRAQAEKQEAYAHVQEVMTLLPGKTEQQKQQIFEKSMQLAVDAVRYASDKKEAEANQKILNMTNGYLSLKDLKSIAVGIVGGAGYHYEKEKDRNSAKRNHRERTYNSKGKITGETYYEYAK